MPFQGADLILEFSQGLHCYLERNQNRDNIIVVESLPDCTHTFLFLTHTFISESLQSWIRYLNPTASEWPSRKIDSQAKWRRGGRYGTFLWTQGASFIHSKRGPSMRVPAWDFQRLCLSAGEVCVGTVWALRDVPKSPFASRSIHCGREGANIETQTYASLVKQRCQNTPAAEKWISTEMLKELVRYVLGKVNSVDRLRLARFIEMKMFHRFVHNIKGFCGLTCHHILDVSEI